MEHFVPRKKCCNFAANLTRMDEIIKAITTVGFPCVMCLLLWRYMTQQSERHEKETQALKDTISNNTQVLTELATMIKILVGRNE